jgi:hypothetical protein
MRPKLFPVVENRLEELLNSKFKIIIRKTSIIRKVLRILASNIFHYAKKNAYYSGQWLEGLPHGKGIEY